MSEGANNYYYLIIIVGGARSHLILENCLSTIFAQKRDYLQEVEA